MSHEKRRYEICQGQISDRKYPPEHRTQYTYHSGAEPESIIPKLTFLDVLVDISFLLLSAY